MGRDEHQGDREREAGSARIGGRDRGNGEKEEKNREGDGGRWDELPPDISHSTEANPNDVYHGHFNTSA